MPAPKPSKPAIPDIPTGVHRLLCVAHCDRGVKESEWAGKKRTIHSILMIHETKRVIDDPDSELHEKPWLIFTSFNYWYGRKGSTGRQPHVIPFIEAHLGRQMTDDEKYTPGKMFCIEELVGGTVKADIFVNERGYPTAKSWFPDTDDEGAMNKPWKRKSNYLYSQEFEDGYFLSPVDHKIMNLSYEQVMDKTLDDLDLTFPPSEENSSDFD